GRHVIVTGANTGLGFETARALAAHGAVVTVAARSREKGEAAVAAIRARHPRAQVAFRALDLSTIAGVDRFADAYIADGNPLHVLVCNAGVLAPDAATDGGGRAVSGDGVEAHFAVNHLAHFRLATRLAAAGAGADPSRVVMVSSIASVLLTPAEGLRFTDVLGGGGGSSDGWALYGQSKLANVLFANEATRRAAREARRVVAVSLHPGVIKSTELARRPSLGSVARLVWAMLRRARAVELARGAKDVRAGAATTVYCALAPEVEG
ncbi:hypothetical protein DFJ73DRAFT_947457, partial [Zopfochytrium polystomum]